MDEVDNYMDEVIMMKIIIHVIMDEVDKIIIHVIMDEDNYTCNNGWSR